MHLPTFAGFYYHFIRFSPHLLKKYLVFQNIPFTFAIVIGITI